MEDRDACPVLEFSVLEFRFEDDAFFPVQCDTEAHVQFYGEETAVGLELNLDYLEATCLQRVAYIENVFGGLSVGGLDICLYGPDAAVGTG